ncbi:MAG: hypothetical protein IPF92_08285 [Myxococcales bacterium]|nr:hypothetical protein [Myxococcales bacterium]
MNRAWQRAREARLASLGVGPATLATRDAAPLWRQALAVLATFHFVCVAWIFFRAQTFAQAKLLLLRTVGVREVMDPVTTELKTVLSFTLTTPNLSAKVLLALALGFVTHFLPRRAYEGAYEAFRRSPAVLQGVMLAVVAYALHLAAGAKSEPFVYGQF